jgi:hypothetical protein
MRSRRLEAMNAIGSKAVASGQWSGWMAKVKPRKRIMSFVKRDAFTCH